MTAAHTEAGWIRICDESALIPGAGVAARLNDTQIAIFCSMHDAKQLWAVGNYDPIGGANVISRGIIGDLNNEPVVASPLYNLHFRLRTGVCQEDDSKTLPVYRVTVRDGAVWVAH